MSTHDEDDITYSITARGKQIVDEYLNYILDSAVNSWNDPLKALKANLWLAGLVGKQDMSALGLLLYISMNDPIFIEMSAVNLELPN